ncbi:unnamed protein product [Spirodela intermedia]|uniref:Uncharacterized protein n=1 Tax=Spirodela intermedia TaxID=51605 RepID=A0ABN7E8C1_SPIIN|nr:unnamed protein product [Spirodela intermedia]
MDNLRDLVVNAEFLGRKHVDLQMRVRVSFVSIFRSITSHNHDIIMALIPYHQCGDALCLSAQDRQQGTS